MTHSFDFAISAKVSAAVVTEMIKNVIEEQTSRKVKSIDFLQKTNYGHMDQGNSVVFDGCTVYFENEKGRSTRGTYEYR